MAQLLHDVILAGGDVTVRHFASLDDLMQVPQRVVINCTGMGARDLFNDLDLRPVKGQIILHEPRKLRFTLGEGDYVAIPRSDALILGTLFDEQFDEDGPTDEATERIWLAVNRWLRPGDGVFGTKTYSLSREKIRTIMAGFRPYRSNGIRLQPEIIDRKVFIHNYGHGGGGITFSWGCSRDCLELVRKFALT